MDELNLDQVPQDINKEEFQLERVCLQAFVAAAHPGCKKELIRSTMSTILAIEHDIHIDIDNGIKDFAMKKTRKELWFQQDGATCHTARATIDLLKDTFGDRLISRFGPVNWPPRSCGLTPLDYFLWGYVKSLVYADKPQTLDHLEDNIRRVIADIRPQMLEKVIENWTSRLDYIRASRGCPMPEIIFKMSLSSKIKQVKVFEKQVCVSEKAQVASYDIAELIALNLKPHNLAEEIILPACHKIVKTMIGGSADIDICKIPLSNDTIHRRIKDMSENIEQNTAKTLANSNFALQVDERTDITGNAQLIAFVRFIHENDIINQFLCCRELPDFTTDGAPAMTGHLTGFVAHVKELNEDILVTHCFLHREALVTKFLPSDLKIVLEHCVKIYMVNYIKSRPLKSRLFSKLCQAMEAKYESLLLYTEVRWLSSGKVISRVLKLKDEMKIFFEQNKNYEFVHLLEDKIWCTKLAYLSDIFVIFNNINSSMQGPNENILNSTDKLVGFKKQITLWKNKAQEGNVEKFESVPKDSYKTIKLIVVDHLTTLEERIIHYFPKLDIKKFDWVRNPFLITYTSAFDLTLNEEEELILPSNNRDLI
ncbi:SCAN domain-containing protein 3 [Trichonephila clavipes]|nr:SCAN domain-containing protein 3 [Trichonephila clavipes]